MRSKKTETINPVIEPEIMEEVQSFYDKILRLPPDYRMYLNGVAAGLLMAENLGGAGSNVRPEGRG